MIAPVVTQAWEAFCDHSYYDMWCVRKVGDRTFGQGFHVIRQDEADALRDLLNTRATEAEFAARIEGLEAECFRLAAGACINPGQHGLVGDERGNSICTAHEALIAEEKAHADRIAEFAAREAALVEALERIAHETRRRQLPLTSLIYDLATTALTARAHTTSEAPDA